MTQHKLCSHHGSQLYFSLTFSCCYGVCLFPARSWLLECFSALSRHNIALVCRFIQCFDSVTVYVVFACLSKAVCLFSIFLGKNKEMRHVSRLLQNTVYTQNTCEKTDTNTSYISVSPPCAFISTILATGFNICPFPCFIACIFPSGVPGCAFRYGVIFVPVF